MRPVAIVGVIALAGLIIWLIISKEKHGTSVSEKIRPIGPLAKIDQKLAEGIALGFVDAVHPDDSGNCQSGYSLYTTDDGTLWCVNDSEAVVYVNTPASLYT